MHTHTNTHTQKFEMLKILRDMSLNKTEMTILEISHRIFKTKLFQLKHKILLNKFEDVMNG